MVRMPPAASAIAKAVYPGSVSESRANPAQEATPATSVTEPQSRKMPPAF
ncbi:hypothetical protein ACT3UD_14030 [Glutamicibacter sp. 287]